MKNELLTIGPFTIHGYGLMIAIGILLAYMVTEYRAKKHHLDNGQFPTLIIIALLGGLLGAKLLYYVTEINAIIANPAILLNVSDGFVVYGGIIGGILTGYLLCKKLKLDFLKCFDIVIPSVALAQGFGRLGCFLSGCCYGVKTTSPLGITFHESHFAPNGVSLVPTQLISSGLDFLNFFVLLFISRHQKADGQVAGFYLIFYSAGRFILEFFRGDLVRGNVGLLSTSQFISIFTLVAGLLFVVIRGKKAAVIDEQCS